jgi:hypothetical protein
MSHTMKLSLAIGLALLAAVLNAIWLSAEKRPTSYAAAASTLKGGQEITADMLTAVPVPGDPERLRMALIPYANRAILFGLKAPREYVAGDMFFQRDIQAPLELSRYEVLGPFKLIGVGERFAQTGVEPVDESFSSSGNNVTIAVSANFDERTRRLLEIIDPSQRAQAPDRALRIVAVQVIPKEEQSQTPAPDDKNVVYQTVSLDGIENVPRVLLAGDVIRFVIPVSNPL